MAGLRKCTLKYKRFHLSLVYDPTISSSKARLKEKSERGSEIIIRSIENTKITCNKENVANTRIC